MKLKALVMEGSLDTFTVEEVLEAVGISRQYMEVVFGDDTTDTGKILVKAGQVLGAEAPPDEGTPAFVKLMQQPASDFKVYRNAPPASYTTPIGTLAELIKLARAESAPESTSASRAVVLEGSFDAYAIDEVLEVVGLSRQVMELVVTRGDGAECVAWSKAGQLLHAESPRGGLEGEAAFLDIFVDPGASFVVNRLVLGDAPPPSLGTLADLVTRGQIARDHAAAETQAPQALVMEGSLENVDIGDVLEVIGLSRLILELVLEDAEGPVGAVVAKAGVVLDAQTTRSELAGREAFLDLYRSDATNFRVLQRAPREVHGEPVGRLDQLIDEAEMLLDALVDPTSIHPGRQIVMEGDFESFTLEEVFDVVNLSRQLLEVMLYREDRLLGSVVVKAGQVLGALASSGIEGLAAFDTLRVDPGQRFVVYRSPRPERFGTPIGRLDAMLKAPPTLAAATPAGVGRDGDVVLEGTFADFSTDELFEVVGISRQYMVVQLLTAGATVGHVLVKSGQVLEVRHADLQGVEAFAALLADPGERFIVRRQASAHVGAPIGELRTMLQHARERQAETPPEKHTVVLAGTFEDTPMDDLLEAVALARQHLDVVLQDDGDTYGTLTIKAGRVLAATMGDLDGKAAFNELLAQPRGSFEVRRSPTPTTLPEPLGGLATLVSEARAAASASERKVVLEGSFSDFSLVEVLETVSLSRQVLEIGFRTGGKATGGMLVKAGRVLLAKTRTHRADPLAAIDALMDEPGDSFTVYLRQPPRKIPKPHAMLADLVRRLEPAAPPPPKQLDPDDMPGFDDEDEEVTMVADIGAVANLRTPTPAPSVARPAPVARTPRPTPTPVSARRRTPTPATPTGAAPPGDDLAALSQAVRELRDRVAPTLGDRAETDLAAALAVMSELEKEVERQGRVLAERSAPPAGDRTLLQALLAVHVATLLVLVVLAASLWM